ncbi:MAG TPA: MYXO-CTERM sorting domain-containing protein [Polyangiales bacterium]
MSTRIPVSVRALFVVFLGLVALCTSSVASAAGRVQWKSKNFKERSDKSWNLEVAIYLPSAPDIPHVPMKFEFQPEVYYERDELDGDKIVERKVPLENRQALIESVDVEFLDSGTGKIEPRTRFTFKLTRAHGYEAGEYKVSIHDGRNDQAVGAPVTLIFDGENEIIDRRAMVFTGNEKKKKADDTKKVDDDKAASGDDKKSDDAKPASDSDSPAPTPATDSAPKADDKPADEPGTIKEKPGGCGCVVAGGGESEPAGLGLTVLGLSLVLLRRRKRAA